MILLGSCYVWYRYSNGISAQTTIPVKVSTTKVIKKNLEHIIELVGVVYSLETVAVKSRIDSQITKICFQNGQLVQEGQILFELDNRLLMAQLQQQEAILERDQAELERATLNFERDQKLSKKGFASSEQTDSVRQAYRSAVATVQADQNY